MAFLVKSGTMQKAEKVKVGRFVPHLFLCFHLEMHSSKYFDSVLESEFLHINFGFPKLGLSSCYSKVCISCWNDIAHTEISTGMLFENNMLNEL